MKNLRINRKKNYIYAIHCDRFYLDEKNIITVWFFRDRQALPNYYKISTKSLIWKLLKKCLENCEYKIEKRNDYISIQYNF